MKTFCLVCFTICFVRIRSYLLGVPVFSSGIFDLVCGWLGKFAVLFPSGCVPISGTCKLLVSE